MVTLAARTQAVDPLGGGTSRTLNHPGCWPITGRADGEPYHRPGTVPSGALPGAAKRGIVPLAVATRLPPAGAATSSGPVPACTWAAAAAGRAGASWLHPAVSAVADAMAVAVRIPSPRRDRRGLDDTAEASGPRRKGVRIGAPRSEVWPGRLAAGAD